MPGELCYWIFNMSIIATVTGLFVLLIRKIKFIPRRVSVFLWIIPFVRMCVPFGLNSRYSLMTLISRVTTKTATVYQASDDISFSLTNTIMAANSYFPITYKVNALDAVFEIAGIIWLVGAAAILIALAILYASTKRAVKDSRLLEGNVYLSDKVEGPAVYGVIKPRIVLPASYADRELKHVLRHEKAHIRRLDNLWRLLAFCAAALHWFNPFSWVFLKAFLSDLELACDESAVSGCDDAERKEYALALLDCTRSKSLFVSAFGGARVRTRIENVLSYKRMTAVSAVGFALLIGIIIYSLLTNAG